MSSTARLITALDAPEAADAQTGLGLVGGKGMNLARLKRAGLPVPGGFMLTTDAYRDFVAYNGLQAAIMDALRGVVETDPGQLEAASERIRAAFRAGEMPEMTRAALRQEYRDLAGGADDGGAEAGGAEAGGPRVAVRSSATAEDLPELSFAGQQDTYLNICGESALLKAVVDCWSSLWTARAIGYRLRNQIPQAESALAVVVQAMVESQVSGVLFSANPLTGARGETVINAAYGLGEALVSGKVEPDQYLVDIAAGVIRSKRLGAKALSIHGQGGGGLTEVTRERKGEQALSDPQILDLARLARRAAKLYETPQDIEWAWAEGQFVLLQSRPVTSLFPVPENLPAGSLQVLFSFAAVQGMMDPISPLGRDMLRGFFAAAAGLFGFRYTAETQRVLYAAGERLWVNITQLARNTTGRKLLLVALKMVEASAAQALEQIIDEPGLRPGRAGVRPRTVFRILRFFVPLAANAVMNMAAPARRRRVIYARGERLVADLKAQTGAAAGGPYQRLEHTLRVVTGMVSQRLPANFIPLISAVATGIASLNLVSKLASELPGQQADHRPGGWGPLALDTIRGLPNNPTTEMDLKLWAVARKIQAASELLALFSGSPPAELAERYTRGTLHPEAARLVTEFLEAYGARGLAEIDIGRPRWREEPLHIFEVLAGYIQIKDAFMAPDAVFERGGQAAGAAVDRLVQGLRARRGGWFKAHLARFAVRRVRAFYSFRESPKFMVVRLLDAFRAALLDVGAELVQRGALDLPDDLMYLSLAELRDFAAQRGGAWQEVIRQRRVNYQREMRRKQVPRLLLSDGRAFYAGLSAAPGSSIDGRTLHGSPVSPGSAEGRVRVVLDPRRANLLPGEILVCPGTDPSWTPLFLTAAALVMEVGGLMTHGAVVAREYGIPAVAGVDRAVEVLTTGQRVRVDGSTGLIEILDG